MPGLVRAAAKAAFSLLDLPFGAFAGPRILIYHQIGAGNGKQMDLDPHHFALHLDYLASSDLVVVSLEEAIGGRGQGDADRKVVLTFDDGYDDMYHNAYPLLEDRQLPFTLYLTSDPVESQRPLSDDGKSTPLSWDQVNAMHESGLMTLGAHTHTHPDFRSISPAQADDEVGSSNELIQRRTGHRPVHFAYPWGYWAASTAGAVAAAYETAVLGGGAPIVDSTDPLMLNRIPIQLDDAFRYFKHKVQRGQRTEEFVRRRITGYRGP